LLLVVFMAPSYGTGTEDRAETGSTQSISYAGRRYVMIAALNAKTSITLARVVLKGTLPVSA